MQALLYDDLNSHFKDNRSHKRDVQDNGTNAWLNAVGKSWSQIAQQSKAPSQIRPSPSSAQPQRNHRPEDLTRSELAWGGHLEEDAEIDNDWAGSFAPHRIPPQAIPNGTGQKASSTGKDEAVTSGKFPTNLLTIL